MGILTVLCTGLTDGGVPPPGSWAQVLHLGHGMDPELFESPPYGDTPPFPEICQVEAMAGDRSVDAVIS